MTLRQQAYGLIDILPEENVCAVIQVMMRMLAYEFDVSNKETAHAIREGRAGIGLRSFANMALVFDAPDSEPDDRASLTDLLTGILKSGSDPDMAREESLKVKYELAD